MASLLGKFQTGETYFREQGGAHPKVLQVKASGSKSGGLYVQSPRPTVE